MIREHDRVALKCDLPQYGLARGDVGTVVHVHRDAGYGAEFIALDGETVAMVSLAQEQVRPVGHGDIQHARPLERRA